MKNSLLFIFCLLTSFTAVRAQVLKAMPPDANDFYNTSMPLLRPQVKNLVMQWAQGMNQHKANADSLFQSLKKNAYLKNMNNGDINGIIVLIMVQASKNADTDLKNIVLGISHKNENHKDAQSVSQTTNSSKDEMIDMQKLKLQILIDHKSDMAEEVSYVMQKISGSQQNIIDSLK